MNISPQAEAIFDAKLSELLLDCNKRIVEIKMEFNKRNVLYSSMTVRAIHDHIENCIKECSRISISSTIQAFESFELKISDTTLTELLNCYDDNFSKGSQQLEAIGRSETSQICHSLSNSTLVSWDNLYQILKNTQILAYAEIRQYHAGLMKKRKKWYEHPLISGVIKAIKIF